MEELCLEAISHQLFFGRGRILRNSFRLFSGQNLTMELSALVCFRYYDSLGGVQRLIPAQVREMRRGLLVAVLAGRGAFTFTSWFPIAVVAVNRLPGREEAWPARRFSSWRRPGREEARRVGSRPGSRARSGS